MNDDLNAVLAEYMAAVEADNSKTKETKASIGEHLQKFVQFVEAKANAPKTEELPVNESEPKKVEMA